MAHALQLAALAALCLAQPCDGQMGMMGRGHGMQGSMNRHHLAMMQGIDPRYRTRADPLPPTPEKRKAGKMLYSKHCASCHGPSGLGDGAAGRGLWPRPANIAAMSKMPMSSDAYLYWTIAEGGAPVGSAMPPFRQTLDEDEIWQVIAYVRAL